MLKTHYCLGFAFSHDYKTILLIQKLKPEWQKNKLNGVGGKIEDRETPKIAMIREFREETGMLTTLDDWEDTLTMEGNDWKVWCFRSFLDISKAITQEEEKLSICIVGSLPTGWMIPNLDWLIPLHADDNPFNEYTVMVRSHR